MATDAFGVKLCLLFLLVPCVVGVAREDINVSHVVRDAQATVAVAKFATLATLASDGTINARVVYPKPPHEHLGESPELHFIRFPAMAEGKKYKEVLANPNATLVYYDDAGKGEVTLKGRVAVCSSTEATEGWDESWRTNYPQGPQTPGYKLLRFETHALEFVSIDRFYRLDKLGL
mmetsp:Transcript_115056/g.245783  ORF Transcript_115056/g.245783 Transcript_115056/m.245783 type:complete len:176 (+) Transcript_115056:74-601(+)